jgi:quercetin dioxygenase-like cupin family protein
MEQDLLDPRQRAFQVDRSRLDRSIWYSGYLLTFLATAEETGGRFSLVEEVGQRGLSVEPPLHVQTREEESFYVIEGEMRFQVGDDVIEAPAGSFVTLPRAVPHRFEIVSEQVRMLNLCTPAGFEGFFRELGRPASAHDAAAERRVRSPATPASGR